MKLFKQKSGAVVLVILFLMALFIASLVFLLFLEPVAVMIDTARNMTEVSASAAATKTVNRIEKVWYIIPVLMFILIIVWAIARAMYREELSGY